MPVAKPGIIPATRLVILFCVEALKHFFKNKTVMDNKEKLKIKTIKKDKSDCHSSCTAKFCVMNADA